MIETSWGPFGYLCRGTRLVATFLPQDMRGVRRLIAESGQDAIEDDTLLPGFGRQVVDYFCGRGKRFSVCVDLSDVSPFRRAVLEQCRGVPFGRTASYRDLARAAGNPAAVRAAGGAMAHNPLPLVIPCHRVVRADGSIGGFSSEEGVALKKRLLRHEGVVLRAGVVVGESAASVA